MDLLIPCEEGIYELDMGLGPKLGGYNIVALSHMEMGSTSKGQPIEGFRQVQRAQRVG